jgi:hypothetical protein
VRAFLAAFIFAVVLLIIGIIVSNYNNLQTTVTETR